MDDKTLYELGIIKQIIDAYRANGLVVYIMGFRYPSDAHQIEHMAVVADFEQHCDPNDYETWMLVERDCYSEIEVAQMLGIDKSDVVGAIRRVERIRKKYEHKVEAAERKSKAAKKKRGRRQ